MVAEDVMKNNVLTVSPQTIIKDAMNLLVQSEVSGLIVVDEKEEVVGVVTEKDLLVAFDDMGKISGPIEKIISRNIISAKKDTPLGDVSKLLFKNGVRRVPVIENNKVLGVISRHDVLKCIVTHADELESMS